MTTVYKVYHHNTLVKYKIILQCKRQKCMKGRLT